MVLCFISCLPNSGVFSFNNDTAEIIETASVSICHQTFTFKDVKPRSTITQSYKITGDSSFEVSIKTASGKTTAAADGYVTNGMDFQHNIIFTDQSVKIIDMTKH